MEGGTCQSRVEHFTSPQPGTGASIVRCYQSGISEALLFPVSLTVESRQCFEIRSQRTTVAI